MIYTLTLNPALDRTIHVDGLTCDVANRIIEEHRFPGGKGIDVSKVLTALGTPNTALGFVGGFRGDELEALLLGEGVSCDFIRIAGETRSNIIVREHDTGCQMMLNSKGPEVEPAAIMSLLRRLRRLQRYGAPDHRRLPPAERQARYLSRLHRDRTRSRGEGRARRGRRSPPRRHSGAAIRDQAERPRARRARRPRARGGGSGDSRRAAHHSKTGSKSVLASMGPDGILLSTRDGAWHAVPPAVKAINTIGAGDSAVAGFVHGIRLGLRPEEAVALGRGGRNRDHHARGDRARTERGDRGAIAADPDRSHRLEPACEHDKEGRGGLGRRGDVPTRDPLARISEVLADRDPDVLAKVPENGREHRHRECGVRDQKHNPAPLNLVRGGGQGLLHGRARER